MPVYTYRCGNCGVQFEKHQSFDDAPLRTCPECKKKALQKVITSSKVIFKGPGFYATDHKSPSGESSAKTSEKKEKEKETKSASTETKSTDTKSTESKPTVSESSE